MALGDVYIWQERTGSISESTDHAIERFTEGRSWAASRAKDASRLSTDQSALVLWRLLASFSLLGLPVLS